MMVHRTNKSIVPGTSRTIKRSTPVASLDTGATCISSVPNIPLSDVCLTNYVQSDDHHLWYKNCDRYLHIRPCEVKISDILLFDDQEQHCIISKCNSRNCKTCSILITDTFFTSNLTKKDYHTRSHDNLNCKSTNVVYGIECSLCGLIYVGETKGQLNQRVNGHRSQINHGGSQVVYKHFNQPDHSIVSMRVRLLEKITIIPTTPT